MLRNLIYSENFGLLLAKYGKLKLLLVPKGNVSTYSFVTCFISGYSMSTSKIAIQITLAVAYLVNVHTSCWWHQSMGHRISIASKSDAKHWGKIPFCWLLIMTRYSSLVPVHGQNIADSAYMTSHMIMSNLLCRHLLFFTQPSFSYDTRKLQCFFYKQL